jgi:hypothetical protein
MRRSLPVRGFMRVYFYYYPFAIGATGCCRVRISYRSRLLAQRNVRKHAEERAGGRGPGEVPPSSWLGELTIPPLQTGPRDRRSSSDKGRECRRVAWRRRVTDTTAERSSPFALRSTTASVVLLA